MMTQQEIETATRLLAEWEQRLKAGGTLTEAEQGQKLVLKLAMTGLRMENVKREDLGAAGRSLRLTETIPDWMTQ
jgi:hypothetical protein